MRIPSSLQSPWLTVYLLAISLGEAGKPRISILIDKRLRSIIISLKCFFNIHIYFDILSQGLKPSLFEDTDVRYANLRLIHAKTTTLHSLHLRPHFRKYQSRLIGPKLLRAASLFRVATESPKSKSFQQPFQWPEPIYYWLINSALSNGPP